MFCGPDRYQFADMAKKATTLHFLTNSLRFLTTVGDTIMNTGCYEQSCLFNITLEFNRLLEYKNSLYYLVWYLFHNWRFHPKYTYCYDWCIRLIIVIRCFILLVVLHYKTLSCSTWNIENCQEKTQNTTATWNSHKNVKIKYL